MASISEPDNLGQPGGGGPKGPQASGRDHDIHAVTDQHPIEVAVLMRLGPYLALYLSSKAIATAHALVWAAFDV